MPRKGQPFSIAAAAFVMGLAVAVLYAIELVDQLGGGWLERFGISPRDPMELPQIYTAPLLHHGWPHLIGNTLPFFLLGVVVLLSSLRRMIISTVASVTTSGLAVWLVAPPHSVTVGASGLVFGWLTYLLTRGIFSRDTRQILLAVVVFLIYGGLLWGVLPGNPFVSWQGHLGGAVGGVLAAWFLHSSSERRRRLDARLGK